MNRQLSAYLDLVRVVCAVVVVLSHLGHGHLVGGYLWPFTFFGNEAVMAFFVLSGFVIAFVTDQREQTLAIYAAARLARLYSVILPAMLLTLVLDSVGQAINADSYLNSHAASGGSAVSGYLLSAVMLNKSWSLDQHFGSDGAYWSIPYEFWYYFIFGAVMLLKGWTRVVFTSIGLAIAGPKIVILLPVWMLGVGAYHLHKHRRPGRLGLLGAIGSLALLAFMLWTDYSSLGQGKWMGMEIPHRVLHCGPHLRNFPGRKVVWQPVCMDCATIGVICWLDVGTLFVSPACDWCDQCGCNQSGPFWLYLGGNDHGAICSSTYPWALV
jgi:peptidoglycan/LPS O-acetylase OafA/YrhL